MWCHLKSLATYEVEQMRRYIWCLLLCCYIEICINWLLNCYTLRCLFFEIMKKFWVSANLFASLISVNENTKPLLWIWLFKTDWKTANSSVIGDSLTLFLVLESLIVLLAVLTCCTSELQPVLYFCEGLFLTPTVWHLLCICDMCHCCLSSHITSLGCLCSV